MNHQQQQASTKIGAGHAAGMGRLGLKELAQIVPATKESIQPQEEMGVFGNRLPQEVYNSIHPEKQMDINKNLEMQM